MRAPWLAIPLAILAAALLGVFSARIFAAPSWTEEYPAGRDLRAPVETVVMRVEGLRCVDTARTLTRQLAGVAGVARCVCYASRNEARIDFDPARVGPAAIREAIEAPVFDEESGEIRFDQFSVLSIDGKDAIR